MTIIRVLAGAILFLLIAAFAIGGAVYLVILIRGSTFTFANVTLALGSIGMAISAFIAGLVERVAGQAFMASPSGQRIQTFLTRARTLGRHRCDLRVLAKLRDLGIEVYPWPSEDLARGGWVYWPVAMTATRRFTNIHAAQCNVLRQLKASRFRVALYLFDDSRRTKDPASEDLSRACDHFTQVAEKGLGTKFDMVRRTSRLWPGTWWRFVRYWRLFRCLVNVLSVLTVQDFREFAEKGNTTQDGASHWQMWHFIEPALTLSFLLHFRDTRKTAVLTLSGSDEKDMWLRLMGCSVAAHRAVFHLFIPQLTQPAGTAAPRRVAMDLDTPFVAWDNEDDIRRALQRYELPPVSGDTGNLFDWIIRHFVCVPHLADPECRLGPWTFDPLRPERLWELATLAGKEQVINHIVDDLSSRLLGGR